MSPQTVSWHRSTSFVLLLCIALAALWDYLFWGVGLGASAAVFTGVFCLVMVGRAPALRRTGQGRAIVAAGLLSVLALVEEPSPLALVIVVVTLGTLVLVSQYDVSLVRDTVSAWFLRVMMLAGMVWVRFVRDNVLVGRWLVRHPRLDRRLFRVLKQIAWWVLPVVVGMIFVGLFALANPVISQFFGHLGEHLQRFFEWAWRLSFARMLLWVFVAVLAYGLLRHRHSWRTRRYAAQRAVVGNGADWLTGPQMIVRLLLVMNVVFAIENVLDAMYLYGGMGLPEGVTYKEYAHRGAYTLIVTALLAGVFTLVAFRQGGGAHRSKACRWMVYVWIGQNIALLVSTVFRVWQFVDVDKLTLLRISTMIWCGVVAAGFLWIVLRIMHSKTNAWLWRMNAFTAAGVLFVCAFINFDGIVASFNVRHCAEAGGRGSELDIFYLEEEGKDALPAIRWMRENPGTLTVKRQEWLANLERDGKAALAADLEDWRSWTFRRSRDVVPEATTAVVHATPVVVEARAVQALRE